MTELLQMTPWLQGTVVLMLGLCIGSFLNVVAWRLPRRMEQEFRAACHEQFGQPAADPEPLASLLRPGSHCPACRTPIRPWHNLPVLGWLLLRGRCAACGVAISPQYPLVEAVTGVMFLVCWQVLGWTPALPAALTFTAFLVVLTVIDLRTMYLPDDLTLPLLWMGLLGSLGGAFASSPAAAIVGGAAGYLSLWLVFWGFKLSTGKEGMGYGDFKLLAALGAWLGWQALPLVILLSAVVGAAVGVGLMLARRVEWSSRIPFGPYLAGAGWIALLWGEAITGRYLQMLRGAAP